MLASVDRAYTDDLIRRVAAKASAEHSSLRLPVSESDLTRAEEYLGFRLHPLLRRLYAEVADGGFGPAYTLFPLETAILRTPGKAAQAAVELRDGERRHGCGGVVATARVGGPGGSSGWARPAAVAR
jgi:hypothetical protein